MAQRNRTRRIGRSTTKSFLDERTGTDDSPRKFGYVPKYSRGGFITITRSVVAEQKRRRRLLRELAQYKHRDIIERVKLFAGSEKQAVDWYRHEPLPAFGGRTAEALVREGRAADVQSYIEHIELGGFA